MRSSAFVFGTDLLGEGIDGVLDNLQDRAGVDAVSLSATYHDARDVFPHNPSYRVYRHEGDVAWFRPDPAAYGSGLQPRVSSDVGDRDVMAELCEQAGRRGMDVHAWTIFLHSSVLATEHPDCATRNVYGDPYLTDLCPANPRVRDYAAELATDLARYPVRRLLAESLHYRPFEHGNHHERYLIDVPVTARTLLSLCFCPHCRRAGDGAGVDTERLTRAVRRALEPVWSGDVRPGEGGLRDEDEVALLEAYVDTRRTVVTGLVDAVHQALAPSGVQLSFIDHAGGMAHVMAGTTADDPVLASSRKLGIDVPRAAAVADELVVLGYVDSTSRLESVLRAYRAELGDAAHLAVALRPLLPDCDDARDLADKVAAVRAAGADRVDFYHYAMMPLARLDWVAGALGGGGDR